MNPDDMKQLGLEAGDRVRLSFDHDGAGPAGTVKPDVECPARAVLCSCPVWPGESGSGPLPRRVLVERTGKEGAGHE